MLADELRRKYKKGIDALFTIDTAHLIILPILKATTTTSTTSTITMQFTTTLLTLALAVAGVSAAPNPAAGLETRQTPGLVIVRFYRGNGCEEPWIEDDAIFDDGSATCRVEPFTGAHGSFRVTSNEATRTCKS